MKNKQPLVSVIMPVYNAGIYLVEAIESILNQTYRNYELIIIDDASTDNSWEIIRKYKNLNPTQIRATRLKKNLNKGGDAGANIGYKISKGKFIARMDADDIAHPERLRKEVEFLLSHPDVLVVGSRAFFIDKEGLVIGEKNVPLTHEEIYEDFFTTNPMVHPSIMIRKKSLPDRKKLYSIKYSANNDYLTFFELLKIGQFANLKEKLVYYRLHGKNDSLIKIKNRFFNTFKIRLLAVFKLSYQPSSKGILLIFPQAIIALLLPEKLMLKLYLLVRRINKPQKYSFNLSPVFSKIKNYALSLL